MPKPRMVPDGLTVVPDGYKVCQGPCGEMLSVEHYHKDTATDDGLKTWCKNCRTEKNQKKRGKRALRAAQKMDHALIRALDQVARNEKPSGIHVCDLVEEVMSILGNSYGFAQHIAANLVMTPLGSPSRTRMLEMLTRLVVKNTELGGANLQLENMTVEELEALYNKRIEERAQQLLRLTIVTEAERVESAG